MQTGPDRPTGAVEPDATPTTYRHEPLGTLELVLLCSFGLDLEAERTGGELRQALRAAGFSGSAVGHLVRECPLVRRTDGGRFRLRPFTPTG